MISLKRWFHKYGEAYCWILPALIIVCFATIFPLFFAFNYSMFDSNVFQKLNFVGFKHYISLINDQRFLINVFNSFIFTIGGIFLALFIGFVLAMFIRKPSRLNSLYRTIILIPWVTNEVVLALMWTWVLNPQMSIIYHWANQFGWSLPNYLGNSQITLVTVTVLNAWRSLGFSLVMILAALAAIPKELEEASLVDGCNRLQRIIHIILPLIKSVVLVMIIVLTMSFFNIVAFILSMTGGGPLYSTELLSLRLYKETFTFFNIPLSSTLTTVMLVINLIFVSIYRRMISDENYY